MATRIGGAQQAPFVPPAGVRVDNRLEQQREQQIKELVDQRLVSNRDQGERVVDNLLRRLQPGRAQSDTPATAAPVLGADSRPPTDDGGRGRPTRNDPRPDGRADNGRGERVDLGRVVADFQRDNGLPVTGKIDATTVESIRQAGGLDAAVTNDAAKPKPAEPAPAKTPAKSEDVSAARANRAAAEQQLRQRIDAPPTRRASEAPREREREPIREREPPRERELPQAERVVDPSRLLLSLVSAGLTGKRGAFEDAVKAFQASVGLPVTGALDAQTEQALQKQKQRVEAEAPPAKSERAVEAKQQTVRRALNEASPTSQTLADRDVQRDPLRPQAGTNQPTTSSEVAARAPSTATSDAFEQARLDTVLAQQAATERGVQEGTGDPTATAAHGEVEGVGAGQQGEGGTVGGGNLAGQGVGAVGTDGGEPGDESAAGNSKAGDDDFQDEARGEANTGDGDEQADESVEHWRVPSLSEQLHAALDKIVRDDDGSGPVTYTWEITFFRPGTYAAGQPAEEVWHVEVHAATAFDPVWQRAADAIAARMLYAEPDADPPTIDDFIQALRKARVR